MANYVFNLDEIKNRLKGVLISNTDKVFEGTSLEFKEFAIEIKVPTRIENIDFESEQLDNRDDSGKVRSLGEYSRSKLTSCIVSITGFDVADNTGKIYTDEELELAGISKLNLIFDEGEDTLLNHIKRTIDNMEAKEEKKSEEQEPVLADTPNG